MEGVPQLICSGKRRLKDKCNLRVRQPARMVKHWSTHQTELYGAAEAISEED